MEIFNVGTQLEKFEISPTFNGFKGIFSSLKHETFYQPYGGLPKQRNESSPLKNCAQVGLRLITDFSESGIVCVKLISETRCLIDFDNPQNEEKIFLEVAEKALVNHRSLLSNALKKINLNHSNFAVINEQEKNTICRIMIEHFRSLF